MTPYDSLPALSGRATYRSITRKKHLLLLLLPVFCLVSLALDIVTGAAMLPLSDVFGALFRPGSVPATTLVIVRTMRLPVALMAVAVGACLGLAGAVMQTILGNPLASPYTLGVGAGASFGASLAIVTGVGVAPVIGEYLVSANAFFFAMLCCLIIYGLGRVRGMSTGTMVLAGIALLFIFEALRALLQYGASESQNQTIVFWTFGNLQRASWSKLTMVVAVLCVCLPLILRHAWQYNALLMGDEKARSLGVRVDRFKLFSFVLVSMLAAIAVCFVGSIGFIGLAGPHIARMLVGEDQRFFLPISALGGALILSVASIISKLIVPGIIFPIGIITSIIGVPFFLILVLTRRH